MVAPQPRKGRTPTCALPRAIAAPFFPFPCTEAVFQGRWVGCFPGGTGPCPLHCAIPREGQPLPPPTAIIIFISLSLSLSLRLLHFFQGWGGMLVGSLAWIFRGERSCPREASAGLLGTLPPYQTAEVSFPLRR